MARAMSEQVTVDKAYLEALEALSDACEDMNFASAAWNGEWSRNEPQILHRDISLAVARLRELRPTPIDVLRTITDELERAMPNTVESMAEDHPLKRALSFGRRILEAHDRDGA